jgi:tetratricopeptide (TPR) repeat protein
MKMLTVLLVLLLFASSPRTAPAQGRVHTLFGDVHVDESKAEKGAKPLLYEIILYNLGGTIVARQFVSSNGRYRFLNLANGQYELAVMLDNEEIGRTRVEIMGATKNDFRQDLALEWKAPINASARPASISAADYYKRAPQNEKLFAKSKELIDRKRYDEALNSLHQLLALDPHDFQAWTEMGTVYLFKQNYDESEKAYLRSIIERPEFFLALKNLGKLRVARGNFVGAIDPLSQGVKLQPTSADANYYLGEAYLQVKKGTKAVQYFYEALKLDPIGKANAHLRIALLYDAAGLKEKAAAEYQAFLKKKPDYPDRRKLEQYIAANRTGTVKR